MPKKEKPNHGKYFEHKAEIGMKYDGTPIRKSFYSLISKADAKKQADAYICGRGWYFRIYFFFFTRGFARSA